MIELVRFRERLPALFLQQVLDEHGIASELRADDGVFSLSLLDAEDFKRARDLTDEVAAAPYDARFQAAARRAARMSGQGRDQGVLSAAPGQRIGPVTRVVLVACVVTFVLGGFQSPVLFDLFPVVMGNQVPAVYQWLMAPHSLDMLVAEPWRIITPVFIHFGMMHIIFNLLWWWILGGIIERNHSALVLVLLTVVTGLAGNGAQYLVAGPGFGGLSGVVYGLFGYLWLAGSVSGDRAQRMPRAVTGWLVGWLVLSALVFPDVIATAAHVGGLVSGCLYGGLAGAWRRWRA